METMHYPQINKFNSQRVLTSIIHRLREEGYEGGYLDIALLERCVPVHYALFKSVVNVAREYRTYVFNLQESFGHDLFSYPSASAAQGVVSAIQLAMLDNENEYINYYIHELNFGEEWREGMVVSRDGTDMPLNSDAALWMVLLYNIKDMVEDYYKNAGVA